MNTIRSMFGLKKSKKNTKKDQTYSHSSSVSSFSSDSSTNDSMPQTPTGMSMQESLGIFRTLEPVWYFQSSLLAHPTLQSNEWVPFDENSQYALEQSLENKPDCVLRQSVLGPCTILFRPATTKTKKQRQSMMTLSTSQHSSMPSLRPNGHIGRTLELNKHVRRTISPVWWFEQDHPDGSKGMCRFDYKNQVRLEALSEDRTRLVLTDDAFNVPFTVVLEAPKERESKEEIRGFLFFEPVSTAFQRAFDATYPEKFSIEDPLYDDEQWGASLTRRFSV
ncbi:uncharacterized protein B0P05DRAFT_539725 [Gilbertella persicaria]|uniref:Uncharacterized protein n=1 Tax=Rhizopus stolonifer TaxID=4846 RepID=A0A367KNW9_RHIST|nr:uncharacterized protein B0P05DRAFT_539725 [Gilbertella persicaria]KAI8080823.1 hypothetical protein B0P05DRAFT_539725 [Gilbertella persicaria]RCI03837.1 hypothetical protein CU098_007203 [Rhizopus stolonifer]